MRCPNCNKIISDDSKFCGFCGADTTSSRSTISSSSTGTIAGKNVRQPKKSRAIIILLAVFIVGCVTGGITTKVVIQHNDPDAIYEQISGVWRRCSDSGRTYSYIEFFNDRTYISSGTNMEGTYSITDDRIRFSGVLVSDDVFDFSYKKLTDELIIGGEEYYRDED